MNWQEAPIGKFWWLVGFNQCTADRDLGGGYIRNGQNLFNTLENVRPDLAEQIRGGLLDPFHFNAGERLDAACEWIEANWSEHEHDWEYSKIHDSRLCRSCSLLQTNV